MVTPMKSPIFTRGWILTKIFKALPEKILGAANDSPSLLLWLACSSMALPMVILVTQGVQRNLGINPLDVLTRRPGYWSLIFLTMALSVAPVRHACVLTAKSLQWQYGKRLSDWNFLIRLRRPIGLASFFYGVIHCSIYFALNLDFNWDDFQDDLFHKPYIVTGVAAFILLIPLAVTSTDGWIKRLKGNWKTLHSTVYIAALLAVSHFYLLSKPGVVHYRPFVGVLGLIFIYRLIKQWQKITLPQDAIDGTVPARTPGSAPGSMSSSSKSGMTVQDLDETI